MQSSESCSQGDHSHTNTYAKCPIQHTCTLLHSVSFSAYPGFIKTDFNIDQYDL